MGIEREAVTKREPCTHGGDADALHRDLTAWADGWAREVHDAAPPIEANPDAHFDYEAQRVRDGFMAQCPERFHGCALATRGIVNRRLIAMHEA
jgi:hypothetical protein